MFQQLLPGLLPPASLPPPPQPGSPERNEELSVGREKHSSAVGAVCEWGGGSGLAALGKALGRAGRMWEQPGQGQGRAYCQPTVIQVPGWALLGDSLITSAVVMSS